MISARRAVLVLSVASLIVGAFGLILARDVGFSADRGEIVFGLGISFNPLGSLVTIGLSILGIVGALAAVRTAVWIAAVGFGLAAAQVLVQFGRDTNWLGTRGSNLSFFGAMAVGLWSMLWLEHNGGERMEPPDDYRNR